MISEHPQTQAHPTTYRDALMSCRPPTHSPTYPSINQAKANAAIKERQILLDLNKDHPIKKQCLSHNEILTIFQKVLLDIKAPDSPDTTIKALKILTNGGILIELPNNDAASWLRQNNTCQSLQPQQRETLTQTR